MLLAASSIRPARTTGESYLNGSTYGAYIGTIGVEEGLLNFWIFFFYLLANRALISSISPPPERGPLPLDSGLAPGDPTTAAEADAASSP